jgi:hypothetical protein
MKHYEEETNTLIELAAEARLPELKRALYAGAEALLTLRKLSMQPTSSPSRTRLRASAEDCLRWSKIPSTGHDANSGYRLGARYEFEQQAQPETIMELFHEIDQQARALEPFDSE